MGLPSAGERKRGGCRMRRSSSARIIGAITAATITLRDPDAELEATFCLEPTLVGCSLRHRGEELLDMRKGLRAYAEAGSTMGIPLLHPWANRLADFGYEIGGRSVRLDRESPLVVRDEHGLPMHGLLPGRRRWSVRESSETRLVAELDFTSDAELLAAFPFPHVLELDAWLAEGALEIATTIRAAGEDAVPIAFGWHPYLRLPDVPRAEWVVRLPVLRRVILDERNLPTGEVEEVEPFEGPLGERTFDDGFDRLEQPRVFGLRGGGRALAVELLEGYSVAQVFAPGHIDVVSFEPMTAPANALRTGEGIGWARPGEPYRARFGIAVR
jgi:galactose mutarotase-like enzyme